MKEALLNLLSSKKALAAIAGTAATTLVMLAGRYNVVLDQAAAESLAQIVLGIVGAYLLGQGAADWGKEKAKVEAAAAELLQSATFKGPNQPDKPQ